MHAHFPQSVFERTYTERVVKILGVDRVDREGQRGPHIAALGDFDRVQHQRNPRRFGLHLGGEVPRKPKFLHDRVNLGLVLAAFPKDFDHLTHRGALGVGPFNKLEHHHLATLGRA